MSDWTYSDEYKNATKSEKAVLDDLSDLLFEVQYAKRGDKAETRRRAALSILSDIKEAFKRYPQQH